jgi:non-specific serine/threonine protein kinase
MLRVKLLGHFEAWLGATPIAAEKWPQRKTQLLLKILLSERGRFFTQDQLLELLFPDHDVTKSAQGLRRRVSELRHVLEPGLPKGTDSQFILHRGAQGYAFNGEALCQLDTEEFVREYEAAQIAERAGRWAPALQGYERAIALYRGDFLEDDIYEEWTTLHRERWRALYLQALARLAECYAHLRQFSRAVECCVRVLAKEPWYEGIYRQKMFYHYYAGEYAQALQTYQACLEALKTHLEVRPSQETQELYQQILKHDVPTLPEVFPTNLPRPLSSFIGREREVSEIKQLIAAGTAIPSPLHPLVTLTGVGGGGKTRLALRVASELLRDFPDGVWWVELGALSDPALVPYAIAASAGLSEESARAITESLTDAFRLKKTLIVMDNCEHLIGACARLVETLLRACPRLQILATSQEALALPGEKAWVVSPLRLPEIASLAPEKENFVAHLREYEALALFEERARSGQPEFTLTAENALTVAQICRQLDGLPLSIELAATRTKALSLEQIATRLDDRFRLLVGGSRTALPRHQALQATIDWSYRLLTEKEKLLLRRVSVFTGGWTLEAAEAVCADATLALSLSDSVSANKKEPDSALSSSSMSSDGKTPKDAQCESLSKDEILDLLAHLIDKSLVIVAKQGSEARYRQLESVHQFGWEKLHEAGEVASMRRQHLEFFLKIANQAMTELQGSNQVVWLERLAKEHDNLRAALQYCVESSEAEMGLRLMTALHRFWYVRAHWSEGRQWAQKFLSMGQSVPASLRARAIYLAGIFAFEQGENQEAVRLFEQALALQKEIGDKRSIAISLNGLGMVAKNQGDFASAQSYYEESLSIGRELGNRQICANLLNNLGNIAHAQGDRAQERALKEEALAIWRELGDKPAIATAIHNLGLLAQSEGDLAAAKLFYSESLTIWQEHGDKSMAYSLFGLGQIACSEGDYARAHILLKESLSIREKIGDKKGILNCLDGLAELAQKEAKPERAAQLLGASESLRQTLGMNAPNETPNDSSQPLRWVQATLGENTFWVVWARGHAMPLEQAIEFALEKNT